MASTIEGGCLCGGVRYRLHDQQQMCDLEQEIGLVAGAFRDIIVRLRKVIVESGDNAPFESRIRFFFRKFCTTVAFHLLFRIGLLNLR